MSKFTIPDNHLIGFDLINSIDDDQTNVIINVLSELPEGANSKDTIQILEGKLQLHKDEINKITNTIFSILNLHINQEIETEEFVDELIRAYEEVKENLNSTKKLKTNLTKFLTSETNAKQVLKASSIIQENEKVYRESRIISDIRLVFDEELEQTHKTAVVIHRLKIEFTESSDYKENYFALDSADLLKLKNVVDRAIEKDKVITKGNYKDINFIDVNK